MGGGGGGGGLGGLWKRLQLMVKIAGKLFSLPDANFHTFKPHIINVEFVYQNLSISQFSLQQDIVHKSSSCEYFHICAVVTTCHSRKLMTEEIVK